MKRNLGAAASEADQAAAFRRVGAALVALGSEAARLSELNTAVSERDRGRYQAVLAGLAEAGYPLEPHDCAFISLAVAVPVPVGPRVCVWAVGPQAGQLYQQPEKVRIVGGPEVPTPGWWTSMLEQLGIIECTQLLVKEWNDIHTALCDGGPDLMLSSGGASR